MVGGGCGGGGDGGYGWQWWWLYQHFPVYHEVSWLTDNNVSFKTVVQHRVDNLLSSYTPHCTFLLHLHT